MSDVQVEGARFHVTEDGDQGPLVVFFHGALATSEAFRSQRTALRNACRMRLVDLRGHGRSSHYGAAVPWSTLSYEQMLRDVEAILDVLAPDEPAHLVGVSMGGLLSANYAARHPHRVASLALLAAPGLLRPERQRFFATTPPEGLVSVAQGLAALWHGEPYWRELARNLFPVFARGEPFPERVPVARALVMQGTEDELLAPAEAEAWVARIDGSVTLLRPPGGHAFFADGRAGSRATNAALRGHLLAEGERKR